MGWIALVSLIISVIRAAIELWPPIVGTLDRIDGMKSPKARFAARGELGKILREHKDGVACSKTCAAKLEVFHASLAG